MPVVGVVQSGKERERDRDRATPADRRRGAVRRGVAHRDVAVSTIAAANVAMRYVAILSLSGDPQCHVRR